MEEKNKISEKLKNLPKFLMVDFNQKAQPVGARPMKDPSNLPKLIEVKFDEKGQPISPKSINELSNYNGQKDSEAGQIYSYVEPTSSVQLFNKEFIKKLLIFVLRNNEILRREVRQSNYNFEQFLKNMKLDFQNQLIDVLSNSVQPLGKKIEDLEEKFAAFKKDLKEIDEDVFQYSLQNQQAVLKIGEKLNTFSRMNDELNSFKTQTIHSINGLLENQKLIKDLLVDQEKIYRTVANESLLKIKNMLKKPKRKPKKPQKAKVIRVLKENFAIGPLSKVLVVTDKRNSTFGQILHESIRKLTEKSIFIITENRKNDVPLDEPVVEAIKQSNYVFIVGKHSLTQLKEISGMLGHSIKIVSIKRSLRYKIL